MLSIAEQLRVLPRQSIGTVGRVYPSCHAYRASPIVHLNLVNGIIHPRIVMIRKNPHAADHHAAGQVSDIDETGDRTQSRIEYTSSGTCITVQSVLFHKIPGPQQYVHGIRNTGATHESCRSIHIPLDTCQSMFGALPGMSWRHAVCSAISIVNARRLDLEPKARMQRSLPTRSLILVGSGTIPRSSAITLNTSTDMMMPVQRRKQILNRVNRPKPSAQRLRMFRILRCIGPHSQLILQPDVRTAESLGGGTECGEMCKRFEGNGIGKRETQIVQFVHNLQGVKRFGERDFHAMLHSTMLRRERDQLLGGGEKQATCCPTLPGRSMRDSRRRLPGR